MGNNHSEKTLSPIFLAPQVTALELTSYKILQKTLSDIYTQGYSCPFIGRTFLGATLSWKLGLFGPCKTLV